MELDLISILKEILSAAIRMRIHACILSIKIFFLTEYIRFSKISIHVCACTHTYLYIQTCPPKPPKQIQTRMSMCPHCLVWKVPPFCGPSEIKWICHNANNKSFADLLLSFSEKMKPPNKSSSKNTAFQINCTTLSVQYYGLDATQYQLKTDILMNHKTNHLSIPQIFTPKNISALSF